MTKGNDYQKQMIAEIFGDEVIDGALQLSEQLERSGIKFKQASEDFLELLNQMPIEMIDAEFLNSLQSWVDAQYEALQNESKQRVEKQVKTSGHQSFFFRPLAQSTVVQKTVNDAPYNIWFGGNK